MTWRIVTMPIETEGDVVAVRQRARQIADRLGFDRQDQTRVATAVSEIARNAFRHAQGGRAEFFLESESSGQVFVIRVTDRGKGIADPEAMLEGRSGAADDGPRLGLIGAKRLINRFRLESPPGAGTSVELGQFLPRRAGPVPRSTVSEIARELAGARADDPLTLMREQDLELVRSLEEIKRRQDEADHLSRELGDTNRGVVALYAELDERAEQLRQASELKSRFLSNMSHEFRTPLNSILALSRLLLDEIDGKLNTEQEKQVGYIRRSAEGLLELVNDLLDLAKVEAGKIEIKPVAFSVSDLFGALRGALKPLQSNAAVDLTFDAHPELPDLFTDEAKVAQILRNLVSNALKFTELGEVRVTALLDSDRDRIVFSVSDTGIGIAPEDQERIFEEFSQLDSRLQRKVKGTGLGLSLSRNLAGLLGGDIAVESVPGQGSVFRLAIPRSLAADGQVAGPRPDADRRRILLVDDDETFRYVFHQMLKGNARYEVLDAVDGADGLRRAREQRPDVIILDLQMPHLDGFGLLRELAADPELGRVPVVISTSLNVTPELRSRLPSGMPILSKQGISRDSLARTLQDVADDRLAS